MRRTTERIPRAAVIDGPFLIATRLTNAKEQVAADPGPKDGAGSRVLTKSDDVSVAKKRVEVEPAHHLLPRVAGIDGIHLAGSLSFHEVEPAARPALACFDRGPHRIALVGPAGDDADMRKRP